MGKCELWHRAIIAMSFTVIIHAYGTFWIRNYLVSLFVFLLLGATVFKNA